MIRGRPVTLLLVEDDPAHAEIVRRSLAASRVANRLDHVADGQEALDYLFGEGAWRERPDRTRPDLVLLDLRLPRVDGLEVLSRLKADADLRSIPTVILTTSAAETDVARAYGGGAASYLVKPVDFGKLTTLLEAFGFYWLVWNEYPAVG